MEVIEFSRDMSIEYLPDDLIGTGIENTTNCSISVQLYDQIINLAYWTKYNLKPPIIVKLTPLTSSTTNTELSPVYVSIGQPSMELKMTDIYVPTTIRMALGFSKQVRMEVVNDNPDELPNRGKAIELQTNCPELETNTNYHDFLQMFLSNSYMMGTNYMIDTNDFAPNTFVTVKSLTDEFNRPCNFAIIHNRDLDLTWTTYDLS